MKKIFAYTLTLILLLGCFSAFTLNVSATENIIYASDNGLDTNSGASSSNCVKTVEKAVELLNGDGVIVVVGTLTLTNQWNLPYNITATNLTFRGETKDSLLQAADNRWGYAFKCNITFENLTFYSRRTDTTKNFALCANGYNFTIGNNVTLTSTSKNEVYATTNDNTTGDVTISIASGNLDYLYGCYSGKNLNGKFTALISGGTVDSLYLANKSGTVDKVYVKVTGNAVINSIKSGTVITKGLIDLSEWATGTKAWIEEHITGVDADLVKVVAYGETVPQNFWDTQTGGETPTMDANNPTVYISDNGKDSNHGITEDKPVKTLSKANAVLKAYNGGTIVIVDTLTYTSDTSANYRMPLDADGSFTIKGLKTDGTSKFIYNRGNTVLSGNMKFDNLQFVLAPTYQPKLYCEFYSLEFTSTVTMPSSYHYVNEAKGIDTYYYLTVYGGGCNMGTSYDKKQKDSKLILNGGTFDNIYGGAYGAETSGDITIQIGGNAHVTGNVYFGNEDTATVSNAVTSKVNFTMNGGSIDGTVYLGGAGVVGSAIQNYLLADEINLTFTAGTIHKIVCTGTNGAVIDSLKIKVDMTNYAPSETTGYKAATFESIPKKNVTILLKGEHPEDTTTKAEEVTTKEPEAITDAKEEKTEVKGEENTTGNVVEPKEKAGCGSTLVSIVSIFSVAGIAIVMTARKKEQ